MDRRGITGFPMRLAVTAVILSLCVPVLAEMADGFREDACRTEALHQADIIDGCASSLFFSGPGSTRVVELQIPAGYELWVGGEGTDAYSVAVCRGDVPTDRVYMQHPSFRFTGGCVKLTGFVTLRLECQSVDGGCGIGVSVQ